MNLFNLTLFTDIGGAGQLHEEQSGLVFPGGRGIRAEGDFLRGGGGENSSLQEAADVDGSLETQVIVEGEQEGIQATTEEEAAVIFAAEGHGWKAEGQGLPGLTGGKLPEDGIQQDPRGGAGTAPTVTPPPTRLP